MLGGGSANAIGFTVGLGGVGDSYSFVAANFRTGAPPPAGRDEMVLAIDSPSTGGVSLTQVHGRFFHVDFANPANSTFGLGADHTPNAEMTVSGFVDAFTNTTSDLVPQQGTSNKLDTLGDKIMTPVVYQNRGGTESLWADSTVMENFPNGPTAVRWYQFDVTGGNFPAAAAQQQSWDNAGDGLWRWMPSIAVDEGGNTVIGYSTSSTADVLPVTRQVTLGKERASCLRESARRLPARAGVIIRGQKSIPPPAWTSGISTSMPKAAIGTHASASSIL
jgi:hypothetical protein